MEAREERRVLAPILACLAVAAGTIWWLSALGKSGLWSRLPVIIPCFLILNMYLIILGIVVNLRALREIRLGIPLKIRVTAVAIACVCIFLAAFAAPRIHRLFYDEFIYQDIAQNIACAGKAVMSNEASFENGRYRLESWEYNKQPNGYPFLLAMAYKALGVDELYAFILNNFMLGFTAVIVFCLSFLFFRSYMGGVYSMLAYILIPQNIVWANTAAAEPSTAFFAATCVALFTLAARRQSARFFFLATAVAAYASQFRPESALIVPVALAAVAMVRPREFMKPYLWWCCALLLFLIIPCAGHILAVKDLGWGSGGMKFGTQYLLGNLKVNGLFYLRNERFPVIYTALAVFGLVLGGRWKEKMPLILWFVLFWGVFLFFYAGGYDYGVDVRFSLVSYVPLALFTGFGLSSITERLGSVFRKRAQALAAVLPMAACAVVILPFLCFLPQVGTVTEEGWQARADAKYARLFAQELPPHSIVLTHDPCMFLIWGKSAAQLSFASQKRGDVENNLFAKYKGGVFMHWGFWCNVADETQRAFGRYILEKYQCALVRQYKEGGCLYKLFRIKKR